MAIDLSYNLQQCKKRAVLSSPSDMIQQQFEGLEYASILPAPP